MDDTFQLLPRPLIIVSRVFGAFPINPETFDFSKTNLLITVCQSVLPFIQCCIFIFIPDAFIDESQYVIVVKLLFHYVISVANIGSKYTCTFRFKKHLKSLCLEMETTDRFLRTAHNFNPNRSIYLLSLFGLAVFGGAMIPIYITRLVTLILNRVDLTRIAFFMGMYWQNLTVSCTELQFIMIVINLYFQFHQINAALEQILTKIDNMKYSRLRSALCPKECNKNYLQEEEQLMETYYFYDTVSARRTQRRNEADFSREILNLREAHLHLSEALYLLNNLFSIQLFLTLSLCFCCTLLDITYEIFGYFTPRFGKFTFAVVIWVFGYSIRFVSVVLAANRTCLVAKNAGTFVACMANRFLSEATKEELTLFYKHVHSYDFEFSAFGFFALNMNLVTSAIATGTTYLVILFQFQPKTN